MKPKLTAVEVTVDLVEGKAPSDIENPLYSKRAYDYWKRWLCRIALWSQPIITGIAELALDRKIPLTNATIEGQNNSEKTFTSDQNAIVLNQQE